MDEAGIDLQVISHTTPGVQHLDPDTAIPLAREANDALARAVAEHPDRFAGFATLPTSAPEAAADELERAVTELGFRGAMVNGHTNGRFLDDPAFDVLLERFERLGVVLYLHPAEPVPAVRDAYYEGFDPAVSWFLSAAAFGWHAETGLHVLRMVLAGVFDRHPRLQLVIGHMGEMLPFMLARVDDNLPPAVSGLDRLPSEYILSNVHITTSGLFTHPAAAVRAHGLRRRPRALLGRLALRAQHRRPAPARHRAAEPRRPRAAGARQRRAPAGAASPAALALRARTGQRGGAPAARCRWAGDSSSAPDTPIVSSPDSCRVGPTTQPDSAT